MKLYCVYGALVVSNFLVCFYADVLGDWVDDYLTGRLLFSVCIWSMHVQSDDEIPNFVLFSYLLCLEDQQDCSCYSNYVSWDPCRVVDICIQYSTSYIISLVRVIIHEHWMAMLVYTLVVSCGILRDTALNLTINMVLNLSTGS